VAVGERAGPRGRPGPRERVPGEGLVAGRGPRLADAPGAGAEGGQAGAASPRIGVLALQGDVLEHLRLLARVGAAALPVKRPGELDGLDGVLLPGGESTTIGRLASMYGLLEPLRERIRAGLPAFGTCAGAILLAKEVENPPQKSLGAMDIRIRRNAYGRQIDSSIRESQTRLGEKPLEMVFIRAPKITGTGKDVEVLATEHGDPVLVRQGKIMAATFHPELSNDTRVHEEFLKLIENGNKK